MAEQTIWLGIGFLGQALFSARFIVQWLASERVRQSV
ncbi:lipid A biosynthesis domain protein, partial [marine sediment metagenome]